MPTAQQRTRYHGRAYYRRRRRRRLMRDALLVLVISVLLLAAYKFFTRNHSETVPPDAGSIITSENAVYELQTAPPYTVALDAGHGGQDDGAVGVIKEVNLTETTVTYLNQLLAADPNYTSVLCRQNGEGMSIANRAAAATNSKASLFLSIHGNSDETGTASGFECFPTPPGRRYSDQSLQFGNILAQKMGQAGQKLRGETGVRYTYYLGDKESGYDKIIAEASDTTVRADLSFGVVEKVACPSVLVEQCFVTDAADVDAWGDDDGCRAAARIYYEAICAYFNTAPQ